MVRLVFRPYTQVRRSICTSESKRTSTRVSSGFVLPRHSSPSFGSQRMRSRCAALNKKQVQRPRSAAKRAPTEGVVLCILRQPPQRRPLPSFRLWASFDPMTRAHVRLLGPCFKTGRVEHGTLATTAHKRNCCARQVSVLKKELHTHTGCMPHPNTLAQHSAHTKCACTASSISTAVAPLASRPRVGTEHARRRTQAPAPHRPLRLQQRLAVTAGGENHSTVHIACRHTATKARTPACPCTNTHIHGA